jgi:hypothetical protein
MKKLWIIGTLAALALIVFGVVGFAYAQSQNTGTPNKDTGYGCGMFGTSNRQQVNSGRMATPTAPWRMETRTVVME